MVDCRPSSLTLRRLESEASQVSEQVFQLGLLDERRLKEEIAKGKAALRRAGGFRMRRRNTACPRAVALLTIACERELGIRPSPSQILATLAMHEGYVVQLDSGEGKTLAIAMAAILYAWSGRPCHIVTSSEYLAKRDALSMQSLFAICGCGAAALAQDTPVEQLAQFYSNDILYATSRQLLSDFMRDHLLLSGVSGTLRRRLWELRTPLGARRPVMKGTFVAIIDDVGAVLIDEATAPLVISAPGKDSVLEEVTQIARALVDEFQPGRDYVRDREPHPIARFTPEGERRLAARASELPLFWRQGKRCEDAISLAILARDVLQRDRHYAVQQQRIVVLDESIHRLMSGQSWHFGVIQAIEAKEGIALTIPPRTIARTAFQEFFPRYHRLSGSGSALSELRQELWHTYGLRLLYLPSRFPTNPEIVSRYDFANRKEKMDALIEAVEQFQRDRLPVLVGTRRILDTAEIVAHLAELGIECNVLDGKDPDADAQMLSRARGAGCVTVVTGTAGRGSNIAVDNEIAALGGLQVLLYEHHETKRADQLFIAWAGCQGTPDGVQVFASLEDELLTRCSPLWGRPLRCLATWSKLRSRCVAGLIYLSQWTARRQTSRHRRLLLQREEQLDQQLAFYRRVL
jgi:preprotein translocase subunit SecA